MTDNEIIKVLGCCSNGEPCSNCPYQKQCDETNLAEIALDLINRQQAEIENYSRNNRSLTEAVTEMQTALKKQSAKIERLKECPKCVYEYTGEMTDYCSQSPCPNFKTVDEIKAEAIKELMFNLDEEISTYSSNGKDLNVYTWLKNYVKEMVGDAE